jgi:hypothetical protein
LRCEKEQTEYLAERKSKRETRKTEGEGIAVRDDTQNKRMPVPLWLLKQEPKVEKRNSKNEEFSNLSHVKTRTLKHQRVRHPEEKSKSFSALSVSHPPPRRKVKIV